MSSKGIFFFFHVCWVTNGNFRLLLEVSKVPERESYDQYAGHIWENGVIEKHMGPGASKRLEFCCSQHPAVCPQTSRFPSLRLLFVSRNWVLGHLPDTVVGIKDTLYKV